MKFGSWFVEKNMSVIIKTVIYLALSTHVLSGYKAQPYTLQIHLKYNESKRKSAYGLKPGPIGVRKLEGCAVRVMCSFYSFKFIVHV